MPPVVDADAPAGFRRRLEAWIHHPVTEITIIVLIIVSIALLLVEYSVELQPQERWYVVRAGDAITLFFAIELSVRFAVARKKRRFFRRYWADILSIMPLLRPLRFFRLFQLFRLFRLGLLLSRRVSVFRGILRVNVYELWVLLVVTVITVIGAAVMVFIFEPRADGTAFASLGDALWWALHSIIAAEPIGGTPTTVGGRLVMVGLMLAGMSIFAVLTGIVSATMTDRLGGRQEVWEMDLDELENHIVVCGYNDAIPAFLAEVAVDEVLLGMPVVLVNQLEEIPVAIRKAGLPPELFYTLKGDHTKLDVLMRAGVERASRVVVVADAVKPGTAEDRDARTVLAALTIEKIKPGIYCAVELMNQSNESHLKVAGVEAVVMRNDLSGRTLATAVRHPDLVNVIMELVSLHRGQAMSRIPGPEVPTPFAELVTRLKADHNILAIGVEGPDFVPTLNPPSEYLVRPSEWVVILGAARRKKGNARA